MAGGASTFRTKPPDLQSALHLVEKIIMGKREKSKREKLEKIGKGKEGKSDSEIVFFFFFLKSLATHSLSSLLRLFQELLDLLLELGD